MGLRVVVVGRWLRESSIRRRGRTGQRRRLWRRRGGESGLCRGHLGVVWWSRRECLVDGDGEVFGEENGVGS